MIKVCASLLAADFLKIGSELERMKAAGVDYIHLDVMDGRFVPNISFGLPIVAAAKKLGALPGDVHLMIVEPEKYIDAFAEAGAEMITVHAEATNHLHRALNQIRQLGIKAGVSLNPSTSPDCLRYVMGEFDYALVMTVNPGFGGQSLIPQAVRKIGDIKRMIDEAGVNAEIQVDGGVSLETAPEIVEQGATLLVTGSALFSAVDPAAMVGQLKALG